MLAAPPTSARALITVPPWTESSIPKSTHTSSASYLSSASRMLPATALTSCEKPSTIRALARSPNPTSTGPSAPLIRARITWPSGSLIAVINADPFVVTKVAWDDDPPCITLNGHLSNNGTGATRLGGHVDQRPLHGGFQAPR